MATYKSIKYIIPVEAVEHTDSINALSDVDTVATAPADGQILKWNNANSKWYPGDVEESSFSTTQKAIFIFGAHNQIGYSSVTNLVSSSGVVASDNTSVAGSSRDFVSGATYGGDKAIVGPGQMTGQFPGQPSDQNNLLNLISNTGVMASDTTISSGGYKMMMGASHYGGDKAIFGFGFSADSEYSFNVLDATNLVSNVGVWASDTTGVGTARGGLAAASYGGDKAIFGFGDNNNSGVINTTNLVSNAGVVASNNTGVGTARYDLAAAGYGGDKAIFGFGGGYSNITNITNLVSNTGVVASDSTGVGTARGSPAGAGYGGDKAIFGFGRVENSDTRTNITNLVSNTGVVASDSTGVGTSRFGLAAAGISSTA